VALFPVVAAAAQPGIVAGDAPAHPDIPTLPQTSVLPDKPVVSDATELSGMSAPPDTSVLPPGVDVAAPAPATSPVSPAPTAAQRATAKKRRRRTLIIVWTAIGVVVIVAALVFSRWFLLGTQTGQDFLAAYPGTTPLPAWAPQGIPAWLGWQHFLNAFFMVMLVRMGLIIWTGKRPAAMWLRKKPREQSQKIQIELWAHLALDLLWIVNGAIFIVVLFATGQWVRIVPTSWEVFPNAVSSVMQYLSLRVPVENGWVAYNSLQVLGYFATTFLAAPLAAVTGLRMSPLWPTRWQRLSTAYTKEFAKAIHFPVMIYFMAFTVVHVALVVITGPLRNLDYMYASRPDSTWWGAGIFAVSLVAMVAGWFVLMPAVLKRTGSLFGRISR